MHTLFASLIRLFDSAKALAFNNVPNCEEVSAKLYIHLMIRII